MYRFQKIHPHVKATLKSAKFEILITYMLQAYHVGLNANSGGRRTLANDQEKWTFGFGRVCGLVCDLIVQNVLLLFFLLFL